MFLRRSLSILFLAMIPLFPAMAKGPTNLSVSLSSDLAQVSYSGRIYVIFADNRDDRDPLSQMRSGSKVQIVSTPVEDWSGVSPIAFPSNAEASPAKLNNIKAGSYKVQAFLICAPNSSGCDAGGLLGTPKIDKISLRNGTNIKLTLDRAGRVPAELFQ